MRAVPFWSKVKRGSDAECWPWTGPKTKGGYGTYRGTTAHRVAYIATHGPIEAGRVVCHSCDTPGCCNPAPLWVGTQQANLADMRSKGRAGDCRNFGNRNGRTKIGDEEVKQIKILYADGLSQQAIADRLGISQTHTSRIVRGECRGQAA